MSENIEVLLKKANIGDVYSQYLLGVIFAKGDDVTQNGALAVYWYLQAAINLYPPAIWNAGIMIFEGEAGICKDPDLGMRLIEKAASLGDSSACLFMANCYRFGLENKKIDIEMAEKLKREAFESKITQGQFNQIDLEKEFSIYPDKNNGFKKIQ